MPLLNIGEETNNGNAPLTINKVLAALHLAGALPTDLTTQPSDSELTYVVEVPRELSEREVRDLAIVLDQDAIAYYYRGHGFLAGPHADKWGPFNPEFFVLSDGSRLSELLDEEAA
jgi:hypothetical protein